jgi:hypothetical protein
MWMRRNSHPVPPRQISVVPACLRFLKHANGLFF